MAVSIKEIMQIFENLGYQHPKIKIRDWRPKDQKYYVSNIQKIQKNVKWKPTVSPHTGIKRVFQWIQAHKEIFIK